MTDPQAILDELAANPAAARDRFRTLPDGAVLIDALRLASTDHARQILCDVLGFRHEPGAVDALLEVLSSSAHKVRSAAADALAKIADHRAGPSLLARLQLPDPDPGVRRMLAAAVGAVQHREAIPLLMTLLSDPDPSLRGSSAWSLGAMRAEDALPLLEAALSSEQSAYPAQRMREAIALLRTGIERS